MLHCTLAIYYGDNNYLIWHMGKEDLPHMVTLPSTRIVASNNAAFVEVALTDICWNIILETQPPKLPDLAESAHLSFV
jgi:hypothetical protein